MIKWMRIHNQNPGGAPKVSFFGFDMQYPKVAMQNVIAYLQKVDPPAAIWADSLFTPFWAYVNSLAGYTNAPLATKTQCRENLQKVYDHLNSHHAAYEAQSSPEEFARALQSARVAQQGEDHYTRSSFVRDRYMAENTGWLLDQAGPDAKIVLWAHNGHVARKPGWMGDHLDAAYGQEYVPVGFTTRRGAYRAVRAGSGLVTSPLAEPPEGSWELRLASVGGPLLLVDLRSAPPGLRAPIPMRSIGALVSAEQFYPHEAPAWFDLLVYIEETSAAVELKR